MFFNFLVTLEPSIGVGFIRPGANPINIFGIKVEQLLRRYFLMLLMATSFGKMCQNMVSGVKAVA